MDYTHFELDLLDHDVVQVKLDRQAFIRIMDDANYVKYRQGKQYRYHGGQAHGSPANIKPPRAGHWHLCVDMGGGEGPVTVKVHILEEAPKKKRWL